MIFKFKHETQTSSSQEITTQQRAGTR